MTILLLAVGFLGLVGGAELLVRGGAALALRLGIPPLVVGLTVVAWGTSSPELVVSAAGALSGRGDLAFGNVVGSNICNVGLILGLSAIVRPLVVHVDLVRRDVPLMLGVSVALTVLALDRDIGRWEGLAFVLVLVAATAYQLLSERRGPQRSAQDLLAIGGPPPAAQADLRRSLLFVGVGLLILIGGGQAFVSGAVRAARTLGMSEAVIGLTVVAVGTSLPELATSLVAACRGQVDLAVGNVVGSNIFNVLGVLGITALAQPLRGVGVGVTDLAVMLGLAALLLPLARTGWRLDRREGALLLAIYAGYTAWLVL
ncbi:MAG: calcium/sodium antiporter [Candidatus Krumholzibacteriia bacterium]